MSDTNLTDMKLLSVRATAEALSVSRSEAYKLISLGEIPSVRIGNNLRVPLRALQDLIENRQNLRGGVSPEAA